MGWSFSMALVKGRSRAEALETLRMVETSGPPSWARGSYAVSQLENGWVVLFARDYDALWHDELAVLSERGAAAIGFRVEEHVMASDVWAYRNGREQWAILYDCAKGRDVRTRGKPPASYESIRSGALEEQAVRQDVDVVIEVPADMFRQVCGHAFDEILSDFDNFVAVERRQDPTAERYRTGAWLDLACYFAVHGFPLGIMLLILAMFPTTTFEEMAELWLPKPLAMALAYGSLAALVVEVVRRARAYGRRMRFRAGA